MLYNIKMDLRAATYELRDGLLFHNCRELIDKMNKYPFSINMDEWTSNSNKPVFWTLVTYFDEVKGESVVELYESIECKVLNAENILVEICKLFNRDDISDSTNYMHGKKSGFEIKLC